MGGKKTEALAHSNSYFPFLLKQHNEAITVHCISMGAPARASGRVARRGLEEWQEKETTPTRYDSLTTKTAPWYLLLFIG